MGTDNRAELVDAEELDSSDSCTAPSLEALTALHSCHPRGAQELEQLPALLPALVPSSSLPR
jgi:hypothetical protein